jgi:hypothetical protein
MRIDLEQFLAATMVLGTVGALGVAVYSAQPGTFDALVSGASEVVDDEDPPELEVEDTAPAPAPVAIVPSVPKGPDAPPPIIPDPEPDPSDIPPPHGEG